LPIWSAELESTHKLSSADLDDWLPFYLSLQLFSLKKENEPFSSKALLAFCGVNPCTHASSCDSLSFAPLVPTPHRTILNKRICRGPRGPLFQWNRGITFSLNTDFLSYRKGHSVEALTLKPGSHSLLAPFQPFVRPPTGSFIIVRRFLLSLVRVVVNIVKIICLN
jgi:hypothetical protein